jgi:2-iminobutanoate/2-iminopropanoate deaminase
VTLMPTRALRHILAAAVFLTLGALPLAAQAPAREPFGTASPTLTPAIRVGNMVYASGQLGTRRENPDTTIEGQTRIALENTKRVLEMAGTTMELAVRCTVFLVDVADFRGMNSAYREFWPQSPPTRSTVVVKALVVPGAKVEIECMAVMPPS